MKHIYTYIIAFFLFSANLAGQSLELSTENEGTLEDGQVLTINGAASDDLLQALVDVKNTSDTEIDVTVRRVIHEEMEGTTNYFCWGLCFSPSVDTALMNIAIGPNQTSSDFYGDYEPHGIAGTTIISYFFYNEADHEDQVEVEVHFVAEEASSTSIALITEEDGELTNGQAITVNGTPDEETIYAYIDVRNDGELPIDIKVRRVMHEIVDGSTNNFCWSICYQNDVDTSLYTVTLEPGEVTEEFSGDYLPNGNEGTTVISYYFYDERNTDNEVGVEVHYEVETSGILEEEFVSGLNSYPVPAHNHLTLDFTLKNNDNAYITVHNMLGSLVLRQPADQHNSATLLNTSELKNGVYFYNIHNSDRIVATRKFVISH